MRQRIIILAAIFAVSIYAMAQSTHMRINFTNGTQMNIPVESIDYIDWETIGEEPSVHDNTPSGVEAVDLGLSVKWANMNIGAEKITDYGYYFAWGETQGTESGKNSFTWENYFDTYGTPDYNSRGEYKASFYKYKVNSNDLTTVINPEDDAATVNWGTKWRIPTFKEMQELVNNCSWEWVTTNGINGYKVTSKKNGQFIFLPAAGLYGESGLEDSNNSGRYWMSTMSPYFNYCGCMLSVNSNNGGDDNSCQGTAWRCRGLSVRPVSQQK